MAASSSTIVVSCQQTRFDVSEASTFSGLDVKGLNISVVPAAPASSVAHTPNNSIPPTVPTDVKAKPTRKKATTSAAVDDGIEILSNADLKLNCGTRYAFLGRNGSGKSTILQAIAERLVPGIPSSINVAILQQISPSSDHNGDGDSAGDVSSGDRASFTPLARVLASDASRNTIVHEYELLSTAINGISSDDKDNAKLLPTRVLRTLRLNRLRKQLVEVEKNTLLRSRARGSQATKELLTCQRMVQEAERLAQEISCEIEIEPSVLEAETRAAVDLWTELQTQIECFEGEADVQKRAISILSGLGFSETMRETTRFRDLSGGWQMRCRLAETLFQPSDIMILDEPTNFLDLLGIVWLQRFLLDLASQADDDKRITVVVSHDRDFIDSVCDKTVVLRDRELVSFKGNPSCYEADLRSRISHMSKMREANDRQVRAMEKSIGENMRDAKLKGNDNQIRAAKSRQKRMEERMGMQVSATGGRFKLSRDRVGFHNSLRDEIEVPIEEIGGSLVLPEATELRFPGSLVSLEAVGFRYKSSLPPVLQGVDLVMHLGDRVGIVGLNGSGKTTLIELITDATRKPTMGIIGRHAQLKLGYYSQHAVEDLRALYDLKSTALSLMTQEAAGALSTGEIRGLLASLGLPGRIASDVPISKLSGGQLVRLALARIIWNRPNLLVLDEVTTHLDHFTVSALVEALKNFDGALLLVSHDRYLIRSVVQGLETDEFNENVDDDDDDYKRRTVSVMEKGKLKPLEGGLEEFEVSLGKKLQTLAL